MASGKRRSSTLIPRPAIEVPVASPGTLLLHRAETRLNRELACCTIWKARLNRRGFPGEFKERLRSFNLSSAFQPHLNRFRDRRVRLRISTFFRNENQRFVNPDRGASGFVLSKGARVGQQASCCVKLERKRGHRTVRRLLPGPSRRKLSGRDTAPDSVSGTIRRFRQRPATRLQ
jgi:hypothetical protein